MTGIYIHFPFCIQKCAYCDFVSYENMLHEGERYVAALLLEMEEYRGETVDTVYLGGGTPTALPAALLDKVLNGVYRCFKVEQEAEITIEANPGTCTMEGFKTLKGAGVNRISLGVQSFNDEELATIGRIHSPEEAVRAVYFVREAGIENISLDFMFSLPGQTEKSLTETLQKAVSLKPDHLSCYSLTLCEGTPLKNLVDCGELSLPDEDADRALYHFATDFLEKNGYERYEISNFSKPGREARHNTKYWNREAYIGLGAAAHSFYQNYRYENPPSLAAYYDRVSQKLRPEGVFITNDEAMAEFVFLGLRQTKKGICRSEFNTIFHTDFNEHYHKAVEKLTHLGLLTDDGERIILTPQGIDVSNAVFCEFL